ncbi:MAG: thioredoxin domain-containing protein [candidate division WWE3 bacterium]|nr:thioredoxin domain-containing protein [candidate division WWE3 bacterium]
MVKGSSNWVTRYQPLFLPIGILLGGLMVAVAVLTTGGLGRVSPTDDLLPGDSGSGEVQVSVDDDPVLGDANAPVTIIEFSDFQCFYCHLFWKETLPKIKSEYIDKGLVKFVYRDLPLTSIGHDMAQKYAEGAHCAGDQGQFWQMHDKIYEEQEKKEQGATSGITVADVKSWARELGLNGESFDQCLDSGKYAQEVAGDVAAVEQLVQDNPAVFSRGIGTPTFFIGKSDRSGTITGTLIAGAQPLEAFQQAIERELEEAKKSWFNKVLDWLKGLGK